MERAERNQKGGPWRGNCNLLPWRGVCIVRRREGLVEAWESELSEPLTSQGREFRDWLGEGEEWVLGRKMTGRLALKQTEHRRQQGLSGQGNWECRDRLSRWSLGPTENEREVRKALGRDRLEGTSQESTDLGKCTDQFVSMRAHFPTERSWDFFFL